MPIDVTVPGSPGWHLNRQFLRLSDRRRRNRLQLLHDYNSGNAPLPEGADNAREAYLRFQTKARSNFAHLAVAAVSERLQPTGWRTAVDQDESGDAEVGALMQRAGMDVVFSDAHDLALALSECYVVVGPVDQEIGAPLVTCEDPRFMVGETVQGDTRRLSVALKVVYDDRDNEDRAYLYLSGRETASGRAQIWVARRRLSARATVSTAGYSAGSWRSTTSDGPPLIGFDSRGWEWDMTRSGELPHPMIPVVLLRNKDGMGEFEKHTDLLDRINFGILQRLVIAIFQAFRQMAIKGLPDKDKAGNAIDYTGMFTMDPAALWQLPPDAEMWQAEPTDLRPIIEGGKDDIMQFGAVTRTPMSMLMPSGDNQSAEGASFQREGLVFKCDDRITRMSHQWARVASLMLLHAGMPDRADLARLQTIWAPTQRLSLTERADAASKAANDLPRRSRLIRIWNYSPREADQIMSEWEYDNLVAAQTAQALAAAGQPVQPTNPAPSPPEPAPEPAA